MTGLPYEIEQINHRKIAFENKKHGCLTLRCARGAGALNSLGFAPGAQLLETMASDGSEEGRCSMFMVSSKPWPRPHKRPVARRPPFQNTVL